MTSHTFPLSVKRNFSIVPILMRRCSRCNFSFSPSVLNCLYNCKNFLLRLSSFHRNLIQIFSFIQDHHDVIWELTRRLLQLNKLLHWRRKLRNISTSISVPWMIKIIAIALWFVTHAISNILWETFSILLRGVTLCI